MNASGTAPPALKDFPAESSEGLRGDSSNLDLLRSMAVLFVVLCHLPLTGSLVNVSYYHPGALGLLGVVIFFVHTCLVLMLSLQRQMETQGRQRFTTVFFIRRAFRIYPLSMVVVILVSAIPLITSSQTPKVGTIISNLLLVQNLTGHESIPAPLWSLPFEVQMYILLPALFLLVVRSGPKSFRVVGLLWTGMAALVALLWKLGLNYHLIMYFPCFLPGGLAFCSRTSHRSWPSFFLFAYVIASGLLMPLAVARGARENLVAWPVCLGLGLLIPRCREIRFSILRKMGKTIAKYSYGIYLVHGSCIAFGFGFLSAKPPAVQWIGFLAATIGISFIAYHFIEKPGINFGVSLASRWAQRNRPIKEPVTPPLVG